MSSKNVTLSIDEAVYKAYRKYCDVNGLVVSKQVEIMMKTKVKHG
jgi:hypothetical protein